MADESNEMREKLLASMDRPLIRALNDEGISDEFLVKKLKEELDAKVTKQFQYEGNVVIAPDVIAWDVRQRARQDAHKLRGDYPAEKHHLEGTLTDPRSREEREAILAIAREVVDRLRKDGTK